MHRGKFLQHASSSQIPGIKEGKLRGTISTMPRCTQLWIIQKSQPRGHIGQQPSTWCGWSEQILLNQVGCEARKRPAVTDVFFLTSPFIELTRRVDHEIIPLLLFELLQFVRCILIFGIELE